MIIREKQLKMRVRTKQKYGRLIDANISYKNPSDRLTDNTVSQHIQYFLTLSIFSFMENIQHSLSYFLLQPNYKIKIQILRSCEKTHN